MSAFNTAEGTGPHADQPRIGQREIDIAGSHHDINTGPAFEQVVSTEPSQFIVAAVAKQLVGVAATAENIAALAAIERDLAGEVRCVDEIVVRSADQMRPLQVAQHVGANAKQLRVGQKEGVAADLQQFIHSAAAVEHVVAAVAAECVVAFPAVDGIVVTAADQAVVTRAARQRHLAVKGRRIELIAA